MSNTLAAKSGGMFSNTDLRKLIVPLVIEQTLGYFVGVADSMMVSYAGEAAMSGVALVDMYSFLINTLLASIGSGGAVVVAQYIGNRDKEKANLSAGQLIMIASLVSTLVMIFTLTLNGQILHLFYPKVTGEVMDKARLYLVITGFSIPFLGIYNSSAALFRSMKKTNDTMKVSMLMNAINVIGNFIGIFILHADIVGVAVPTLLARMTAGLVMTGMAFSEKNVITLHWKNILAWKKEFIGRILNIAIPNGIENGFFALGRILVTSIVSLFGTAQIAASSAALNIGTIAIIVASGNSLAIVTVVGQCVGAGEYDQAEYYTKKILKISYVGNIVMTLLMWILLPQILGLFSLSPEAAHYAYIMVMIHNIGCCFVHPTSFNLANGLRATGDARYTMIVGMVSMVFFRVGAALFFGVLLNLQIMGVWFAMISDWTFRSICFIYRFKKGTWRNYRAI